ncbi:MAG: radical SAM protein [Desulfobacterota bacterium]|nr:radical SAM protein [Thermodesulfobacteriota bacterium]
MQVLLIHPPVTKPSEPPAGIALLATALRSHGISCVTVDANREGLLELMGMPCAASDTWTRRAARSVNGAIALLRSPEAWRSFDRYCRAVRDCNRMLAVQGATSGVRLSCGDYRDSRRSPLRSADLRDAAYRYEQNPFFPYFSGRIDPLLQNNPQLIGFSLNFLSQALTAFAMIGFIRSSGYTGRIVLGGGLITSWLRRGVHDNPFPDLVDELIDGPGEQRIVALCGKNFHKMIPVTPDYSGSLDPAQYLSPVLILPYRCSCGCYWSKCSFCPETAEGTPYQPLPPDAVIADLNHLVQTLRPGLIHFLDNALSPLLLHALIDHPPRVPWYGFARITEELTDPDFCTRLRQSGCCMLQLGIESCDDRVLEKLRKGITLDRVERALRALQHAGIAVYAYVLFGTPAETPESARRTLAGIVRMSAAIRFLNLAIFTMPLTATDRKQRAPLFYNADLSLCRDLVHPHGWDRAAIRRFLQREFTSHPAIAPIIRRDPPLFTSNHAPFFCPAWEHQEHT